MTAQVHTVSSAEDRVGTVKATLSEQSTAGVISSTTRLAASVMHHFGKDSFSTKIAEKIIPSSMPGCLGNNLSPYCKWLCLRELRATAFGRTSDIFNAESSAQSSKLLKSPGVQRHYHQQKYRNLHLLSVRLYFKIFAGSTQE